MKAILWKEFRENFKWGVLAMLGLGLAEFYALNQRQEFFSFYVQDSDTLCKGSFLMATTFGCAAVGLVLGLVQILPEQRRDQWAALIHRPIPRDVIFRGKALAGFLLYLMATVLPFLACVWYVSTPGNFAAPFVPEMVFPGVADICAGAVYYFAALFVALRRGAWYGSRVFGLLAAVYASLFVANSYQPFYVEVEAAVLMALALFTAAWGAMRTNGLFRTQPWLARVALLAVIFYGVSSAGSLVQMIINSMTPISYYYGTDYVVDINGRPLKQVTSKDDPVAYFDLAGNRIHDEHLSRTSSSGYLLSFTSLSSYIGSPHSTYGRYYGYGSYRAARTYLWASQDVAGENWYYLPKQRVIYGYKSSNRTRIGAIGQDGFVPGYQPVKPFEDRLVSSQTWQLPSIAQFGRVVCYLDFDQRKVVPIFSQPGTEVFGATLLGSYQSDAVISGLAGVALLHETRILDKTGQTFATVPYSRDMDRYGTVSISVKPTHDRIFIQYEPSRWIPYQQSRKMPSYLEETDLKGTVLNSYTLPPTPEQHYTRSWQRYITESVQTPAFYFGNIAYLKIGAWCGSNRLAMGLHYYFADGWPYTKEISKRISAVSGVLAAMTFLWARRMNFSPRRAWAWATFVFAFNLAGLITFRLAVDWPVRVPCPSCQRKRPVEETTCPHCGTAWPSAPKEGIEIFDNERSVVEPVA